MRKRKILVSAYGCEPNRGSEAGVGWNWVLQMARYNELFIITRSNDKDKIEMNIPKQLFENLHFYYYDTCKLLRKVKKREKGLYLYYWFWQIGIIRLVRRLISEHKFDYSMHLSFGSLWMPTFLPFFNVPFIWGPLGGADAVPEQMIKTLPLKQQFLQKFRFLLVRTTMFNPLVYIPSRKAVAILCRTKQNVLAVPGKYRDKTQVILETAMSDEIFSLRKANKREDNCIKIITVGRLIPIKNMNIAIDSIKYLRDSQRNIHLTIIGSGSEYKNMKKRIKNCGLDEEISIIGEMPRNDVLEIMSMSDIFIFPSLKEGGSWSLMEAMALGLPVVCLKWTGMEIITDNQCAFRIDPLSYDYILRKTVEYLDTLVINKPLRERMGAAGRLRMLQKFTWERKGEQIEDILKIIDKGGAGYSKL